MNDILFDIIARKHEEIEGKDYHELESHALSCSRSTISMSAALKSSKSGIIAEFKRKSPSKGWINEGADVCEVVKGYASNAAACSILTDRDFFGGSLEFLVRARECVDIPLLRKDFIIDKYQICEARIAGADAILLIAACLTVDKCRELAAYAHSLSLEVLLEVHTIEELGHVNENIDMLGVNNRNLGSFHTDINNSFTLASEMKRCSGDVVLVSESGIFDSGVIKELREVGFHGFLIGENFMRSDDPSAALQKFVGEL